MDKETEVNESIEGSRSGAAIWMTKCQSIFI